MWFRKKKSKLEFSIQKSNWLDLKVVKLSLTIRTFISIGVMIDCDSNSTTSSKIGRRSIEFELNRASFWNQAWFGSISIKCCPILLEVAPLESTSLIIPIPMYFKNEMSKIKTFSFAHFHFHCENVKFDIFTSETIGIGVITYGDSNGAIFKLIQSLFCKIKQRQAKFEQFHCKNWPDFARNSSN